MSGHLLTAADFRPPRWLRSPHVQSALGSLPPRRRLGAAKLAAAGACATPLQIAAGDAVLQAFHVAIPRQSPLGQVLLLHGWEGSHRSSYIQHGTAALLAAGFAVIQLNFRDHGDTHHLNPGVFHSCRLDEVVQAAVQLQQQFPAPFWGVAGFSLGGNFALRLALASGHVGLQLDEVLAVCPVVHGGRGMAALESGLPFYHWYFMRKWRASLRRKAEVYPGAFPLEASLRHRRMTDLTRWLVESCTDFDSLDAYFEGYSIADDRLSALSVPGAILTSADDPVIPVADFHGLRLPASLELQISPWGGHCGFLENAALEGFAERWVAARMLSARQRGAGTMPV